MMGHNITYVFVEKIEKDIFELSYLELCCIIPVRFNDFRKLYTGCHSYRM